MVCNACICIESISSIYLPLSEPGRIISTPVTFQSERDKHSEMEISVQTDLAALQSWQREQRQPIQDMVWCGSWLLEDPCVCVCVRDCVCEGDTDWWD